MIDASADGIVYTDLFSGVHANYLKSSVATAGYDPEQLPPKGAHDEDFGSESMHKSKVWRDIWSAGQGVGCIGEVKAAGEVVAEMRRDYAAARERLEPLP